jgi:GH25 family lysozyme M1 (1,4-beta-N-acetylmuramidase)
MPQRAVLLRGLAAAAVVLGVVTPIAVGSAPAASAAKVIFGPDVASYQHPHPTKAHPNGQPINWVKVASHGASFAIVKATEGTTYVNPYFAGPYANDYAAAAAAGLVHGSYHFARPAFPVVATAKAQAKFFASTIGPVATKATLPPALDLEVTGGLNRGQLVTWAQTFLLQMRALTGRTPMLYTYPNFWTNDLDDPSALARYPLWMAEYGTPTAPVADLWQYTSGAHIKGIVGNVDMSKFVGTSGSPWSTLSNGTVATPWTPAAPAPPVSVRATALGGAATVSWLPGDTGTARTTSYRVTAEPGGEAVVVSGLTSSALVPDLSTQTAYTFTVTATNKVGTSAASAPTLPVTPVIPTSLATSVSGSLTFGASLPLKAKLVRADTHVALPGKRVLLFRRELPRNVWVQVRRLSTNTRGLASTVLHPRRSAELEAVFPGASGEARAEAFRNYVVRPTVVASLLSASTVKRGTAVAIHGSVSPSRNGQRVYRERYYRGAWHILGTSRVGPRGHYIFRFTPTRRAVAVYRVVAGATKRRGAGYSAKVTLTID